MRPKPPGKRLPSSTLPRSNLDRALELDPRAVDENMQHLASQVRRIPQVSGDRPPEVDLIVGQEVSGSDLLGTMHVIVRDIGDNFEGFVRFARVEGDAEFDHSDPTDTGVWDLTDATLPYEASVTLQPKHGGLIAVAVPYRTFSEPDEIKWVIRQHRYDADFDAELTGHELAFDTDGYPLLSLNGDEDVAKHYVRMTVGDDIASATPGDPSAGTNDGTLAARQGKLRFDGTGGVANKQAAMGKLVGYKVACENADALVNPTIFGPYFKRRGDSKTIPPRVRVVAVRSTNTVAVDLTIDDPALSVTAIEFRKRENGGSLSAYGTGWDRTSGTIGTNVSLTRGEDVSSNPGLDSQFVFRVTWTDELGQTQYIEDTIAVSRLEEVAGVTLLFPNTIAQPATNGTTWNNGASLLRGDTAGVSQFFVVPLVVPGGITITEVALRGSRADATNDKLIAQIFRVDDVGGTTTLATLTHDTTGDQTKAGSISETTSSTYHYSALIEIKGNAGVGDAVFRWVRITYTRPSYDKVY